MSEDFDAEQYRASSAEHWEEAASGWIQRGAEIRDFGAPVSHRMVGEINPQPGQRILELAAGVGETGFLAAELVAPSGGVIISDQAEAMLAGARVRAEELGLANVEFQVFGAEWIDLPVASVDAVLCRWGYMLMADPPAALLETRRVLRPGGRLALAVWEELAANPWAELPLLELIERGLAQAPPAGRPGPFALGDPVRVRDLLIEAGFTDIEVEPVAVHSRHPSFEEYWESRLDISRELHDVVLERPASEIAELRDAVAQRLAPYTAPDGTLSIPGSSLVACAYA